MAPCLPNSVDDGASGVAAEVAPPGTMAVALRLEQSIERRLGYFGQDRFVLFYYEPRGEEVMFSDGRTYGFGCGGWQVFADEVEPLAGPFGLNLGMGGRRAEHVLLIDRGLRRAYFAERRAAERVVAAQVSAGGR